MAGIEDIVKQVVGSLVSNPEILGNLIEHPYSTIKDVSGADYLTREEASQIVTATSALAKDKEFDFNNLGALASSLMSDNGNSVHQLASTLLGGIVNDGATDTSSDAAADIASAVSALSGFMGASDASTAANAASGSIMSPTALANLAGAVTGTSAAAQNSGIDFSDGVDLGEIMTIANSILGAAK